MIEVLPLIVLFVIYPVIVKMNIFPTPRGSLEYLVHPLGDANGDFYFYEKLKLLIPLAALSFLIYLLKRKKVRTRYNVGIALYIVGITVSTLMSPFWSIALKGGGNRYEGYFALLSYGVLALAALNISVENVKRVRLLIYSLLAGGVLVSIAGITEFLGRSIYKIPLLAQWILPGEELMGKVVYPSGGYTSMIEVIKGSPQFHNVSASLGNSNYSGSFAALILGILVVLFLENKRLLQKFLLLIVYSVIFALLLASRSRAGMVAFQAGTLLLLLLKIREVRRLLPSFLALLAVSIGIYSSMDYLSGGVIREQLAKDEGAGSSYKELTADKGGLWLEMYEGVLRIKRAEKELEIYDEVGREVIFEEKEGTIYLKGEKYEKISFRRDSRYQNVIHLNLGGESSYPLVVTKGGFKTIGRDGKAEEIVSPERISFLDKIQKKGSKRIYIWSRSIPLLKKTGLFGYGPDTYPIIYPQNDYFGKFISYGTPYMFISKPHNMYLQMAINTGLLSLLGFLLVVIPYLFQSLKIHSSVGEATEREVISLGIFIGIFSYLIAGLFNDSAVSIAPNFWMVLGLGMALNIFIVKERRERGIERLKRRV
ncbi:polymerase [Propionigenium maris DSM 9537]|uniref:Polymerase n=1 Tax=Propionigenium maris DSM 9537 TaxID=1123000 RepID=A0A9W6GP00_9FUSO|nr:O-antigen ligase family protein [Propionigenium maris]GLI57655.1 polymerase [Propionigenium maris DSM 9537]